MGEFQGNTADFLRGGGEMGARMRETDWSSNPLGAADAWPRSLKTAVRIMLTSRQPMFVWWGPELINLYNDAYCSIMAGKHPGGLGQPASVVWKEIWDDVGPRARSAMEQNEGTYDEALLLIMERNGYAEETYYTFSYSPVPDDDGQPGGIICANTDDTLRIIGERRLALFGDLAARTADARTFEEACTRSASSLATNAWDLPFAMIYLVDAERERAELAATSGIDANHPAVPHSVALDEDAATIWPFGEVLRRQGLVLTDLGGRFDNLPEGAWKRAPYQAVSVPISSSGATGKRGVLVAALNPFRLFDDHYRGFIDLVARQISASIGNAQAYEEERKRAEVLVELDRAKTTFFSNVSHEFRTPLTLMLGPIEDILGESDDDLSRRNRDLLTVIHRNALRLQKLVNTLLDFSRIEAGRMQAAYLETDIATFTADLASTFRSAVERAGLRFLVESGPVHGPVYIDRDMWEKIVLNLLSNAFKFTLEGEIAVRIRQVGPRIELTVSDTGSGIPADALPHIFERFHRVEGTARRTHEGTGIGLALVQELVKLHGGTISVTSTEDVGTIFTVSFPAGSDHLPPDRIGTVRTLASDAAGADLYLEEAKQWLPREVAALGERVAAKAERALRGERPRVVLADDNADMREYVQHLLAPRYDVTACPDGRAALDEIRRSRPELLLTDVMMPELDGFGLLAEIRRDPELASLPVIMLSARAGEEATIEGIEAGADDYLIKPFTARELLARVGAQIDMAAIRRDARSAVEESRATLEMAMEAASLGAWEFDRETGNTTVSDRVRKIFGVDLGEGAVNIWFSQLHPDDRPRVEAEFRAALEGTSNYDTEFRVVDGDQVRWVRSKARLQTRDGRVVLSGIAEDVTARKLAEESLRESAEALLEADRLKDEFLATLSHELRTPLTSILGWTHMLMAETLSKSDRDLAHETIARSARTQSELIEDVLDISRITTGKMRLHRKFHDPATIIDAAVDTVRPAAEAKNIALRVSVDREIGPMHVDADRLQQILWNLLSNAIKFSPPNTSVEVTLHREDSMALIDVRDEGPGIDAQFLPHVFERFRQADSSSKRTSTGLGIGLALVKELTQLHGGSVKVESERGKGAHFTVAIPIVSNREVSADAASGTARSELPAAEPLTGVRVLFVDDSDDARTLIETMLRGKGAEVARAASVDEALTLIDRVHPDIVITDIAMPERDGFDLLRQLRSAEKYSRVPVMALTAQSGRGDENTAAIAGFQRFMRKPVDADELVSSIARLTIGDPSKRNDVRASNTAATPSAPARPAPD